MNTDKKSGSSQNIKKWILFFIVAIPAGYILSFHLLIEVVKQGFLGFIVAAGLEIWLFKIWARYLGITGNGKQAEKKRSGE